uniref:Uncharacterized protein n=1 Tax=Aegilops tauschii subsp. strangulata TaxID=200361 RepID=A0A453T3L1_AEGTS
MDAVDSVVDPLREFAKDSVRLVKRCHKPDRKGKYRARASSSGSGLFSSFARSDADLARRVHQGGGADGDRVRRHGVRRLLRQ